LSDWKNTSRQRSYKFSDDNLPVHRKAHSSS
jgi:hypothetical protein